MKPPRPSRTTRHGPTSPATFVDALAAVRLPNVFNPYAEVCAVHDERDAPRRRQANLQALLQAVARGDCDLWLGRDLGYRGGRRTGLPLTDEAHLADFRAAYRTDAVTKATRTLEVRERTATAVWDIIGRLRRPPLLWNVFPWHPHDPGVPLSNRAHTTRERALGEAVLAELLAWSAPRRIVALGRDAQTAATRFGYDCVYVRHPSHGGQAGFALGMGKLYRFFNAADAG